MLNQSQHFNLYLHQGPGHESCLGWKPLFGTYSFITRHHIEWHYWVIIRPSSVLPVLPIFALLI